MDMGLGFWVMAVFAVVITGIGKSGFAGGVGIVAVPMLAVYVSPVQAAAIMLPLLIMMDLFSVRAWWGKQRNDLLKRLLPGAMLGIFIGYLLFGFLDDTAIKLGLGVMSIAFAFWSLLTPKGNVETRKTVPAIWAQIAGTVGGFTSFIAHAGGPPLNIYLLSLNISRSEFLATTVMAISAINLVKLIPYGLLGQFNLVNLKLALMLAPLTWIGVKLGLWIQSRISDQVFYRTMYGLLGVLGSKLIYDSIF